MSDERQETIDDIVKEIRGNAEHNHALVEVSKYLTEISDRIEAAAKREREATSEKSSAVGNATAMHEALADVYNTLEQLNPYSLHINDISTRRAFISRLCHAKNVIDVARSDPPRNCDVLSDTQEALAAIHEDRGYVNNPIDERRLTVEWLFAESKGATDGSK